MYTAAVADLGKIVHKKVPTGGGDTTIALLDTLHKAAFSYSYASLIRVDLINCATYWLAFFATSPVPAKHRKVHDFKDKF